MAMGGGGMDVDIPTNQMNDLLDQGLNNALNYSEGYTNRAIDTQHGFYQQALDQLLLGRNAMEQGFNQSQALQAPYRDAGYESLDAYMDTLMLSRPEMGSKKLADTLNKEATAQGQRQNLGLFNLGLTGLYDPNGNPNYAPTDYYATDLYGRPIAPTEELLARGITPSQMQEYVQQNMRGTDPAGRYGYTGVGMIDNRRAVNANNMKAGAAAEPFAAWWVDSPSELGNGYYVPGRGTSAVISSDPRLGPMTNHNLNNQIAAHLAQDKRPYAQTLFNQGLLTYNKLNEFLQNQYTPDQQKIAMAYNRGLFNNPTGYTEVF